MRLKKCAGHPEWYQAAVLGVLIAAMSCCIIAATAAVGSAIWFMFNIFTGQL